MTTSKQKVELSEELLKIAHQIVMIERMIESCMEDAIRLRETSPFFSEKEQKLKMEDMKLKLLYLNNEWASKYVYNLQ